MISKYFEKNIPPFSKYLEKHYTRLQDPEGILATCSASPWESRPSNRGRPRRLVPLRRLAGFPEVNHHKLLGLPKAPGTQRLGTHGNLRPRINNGYNKKKKSVI